MTELVDSLEKARRLLDHMAAHGYDDRTLINETFDFTAGDLRELTRLQQENDRLRVALEPFALLLGEDDEDFPDDAPVTVRFGRTTDYSITLADIRRAVAALHPTQGASE